MELQALSGFLIMMTQNGKLLYISDNAAEYLGHSMVSVLFWPFGYQHNNFVIRVRPAAVNVPACAYKL